MDEEWPPPAAVKAVQPLDGFVVHLWFTDGTEKTIDLDPYVRGPIFQPLRDDPAVFRAVTVDKEAGTIVWPNGADLDPDVLRYGLTPAGWEDDAADSERGQRVTAGAASQDKPEV